MKKLISILFAAVLLLLISDIAFAGGGHHGGHHWDGHHSRWSFNFGLVIAPPPVEPVIVYPPRRVVVVEPAPVYVASAPVVVQPVPQQVIVQQSPQVIVQSPPPPPPPAEITVWVQNDNGSKTQINLKRTSDGGYIGPRGEYYSTTPTEEQLRTLYGIKTPKAKPNNFTVWLRNDNGSQTPVTLTPSGNGFIGPSNEFYPSMPTEDQLRALYGLKTSSPDQNSVTIWLQDNQPIVLDKVGDEYIGPKGEHYAAIPSKEQLNMIYGQKPEKIDNGSTVVWLTAPDGRRTPITLQKVDDGYLGPAGEKYNTLPGEEQLKLLYGDASDDSQKELKFEITKSDGTKTTVKLKKQGREFVGPKGERYPSIPTEEQLKLIYGK